MVRWKDIPGYEGIYESSDDGRIRTKEGKTTYTNRHGIRHWKQRELKQKFSPNKRKGRIDAHVCLWKDGKEKTFLVSRLVAMTWVNGYSAGMTVNHIDGNPQNNSANNLEWLSTGDNVRHGFRNGLYPTCHPIRLKADNEVLSFRSQAEAGRYLGRNSGYISNARIKGYAMTGTDGKHYEICE